MTTRTRRKKDKEHTITQNLVNLASIDISVRSYRSSTIRAKDGTWLLD